MVVMTLPVPYDLSESEPGQSLPDAAGSRAPTLLASERSGGHGAPQVWTPNAGRLRARGLVGILSAAILTLWVLVVVATWFMTDPQLGLAFLRWFLYTCPLGLLASAATGYFLNSALELWRPTLVSTDGAGIALTGWGDAGTCSGMILWDVQRRIG